MNRSHLLNLKMIVLLISALIVAAGWAGCSHSSSNKTPQKALPSIPDAAAQIFERHCVGCHSGQNAPKGLDLRRDLLVQTAVSVPSAEKTDMLRITPGEPDKSYLMLKIRHDPNIEGKPMPPAAPQLSESDIQTIADWIGQIPR